MILAMVVVLVCVAGGTKKQVFFTKLPGNVEISNGLLCITAKKQSGYSIPYTSVRIVTRGLNTFKYRRIQFRASLAKCKAIGTWPALWMVRSTFLSVLFSLVVCVMLN